MTDFDILSGHDVLAIEDQGRGFYDIYGDSLGNEEFQITADLPLLRQLATSGVELIDRETKAPFDV